MNRTRDVGKEELGALLTCRDKPLVVEFYAPWDIKCRELEESVDAETDGA